MNPQLDFAQRATSLDHGSDCTLSLAAECVGRHEN
jgi:hypothetical protein